MGRDASGPKERKKKGKHRAVRGEGGEHKRHLLNWGGAQTIKSRERVDAIIKQGNEGESEGEGGE